MSKKSETTEVHMPDTVVDNQTPPTEIVKPDPDQTATRRQDATTKALASKALEELTKKYGSKILQRASEHAVHNTAVIPSGIFALDLALGGGWRVGRIHTVFGDPSTGKTTTLLKTIASAQRMCSNCWQYPDLFPDRKCCKKTRSVVVAFLDVEGTYDPAWAALHGVDSDSLLFSQPSSAEETLDVAYKVLIEKVADILVIDSLAFLSPKREIDGSTVDENPGLQPRVIGKGIRKFVMALNEVGNDTGRRPTVFFTNQIRMKVGVMFGSPETVPGGKAPGFAATTEVKFKKPDKEIDKDTGHLLFMDMGFRVEKNKASDPFREDTYRMIMTPTETKNKCDVLDEDRIMNKAEELGLLVKSGASWVVVDEKFRTKEELETKMTHDKAFKYRVRSAIITANR